MITIKLKNFDKIQETLKKSPRKMGQELAVAIKKSALMIERESKKLTPVDTGRLRSSIVSDIRPMRATIAPHTDYAIFVHEGTRYMKSRPFMKEGVEKVDVNKYFEQAIENTLKIFK